MAGGNTNASQERQRIGCDGTNCCFCFTIYFIFGPKLLFKSRPGWKVCFPCVGRLLVGRRVSVHGQQRFLSGTARRTDGQRRGKWRERQLPSVALHSADMDSANQDGGAKYCAGAEAACGRRRQNTSSDGPVEPRRHWRAAPSLKVRRSALHWRWSI